METEFPECLDHKSARKSFFGISLNSAQKLFESSVLYYLEELLIMLFVPFCRYLKAYNSHLLSDKSKGDSDGASTYLEIMKWKIEEEPDMLRDVLPNMLKVTEYNSKNQLYYDADIDI